MDETEGSNRADARQEKPFGPMYNLFFWAVHLGARDGSPSPVGNPSVVPFRWNQIPEHVQYRLEAIALRTLLIGSDDEDTKSKAEELLSQSEQELSETMRVRLEELAERGLYLMDLEVEFERPDAYTTVDSLVGTILTYCEESARMDRA